MELARWPYTGYRKMNIKLFDLMPKGWRGFFQHNLVLNLISITLTSQLFSNFVFNQKTLFWLQYFVDFNSANNGLQVRS